MNLDQIATKCFILALFIRDDGQRLLLGDGYYDFNQKLQHFQANTIANDIVEIQGDSGQLLAGQVMRSGAQKFEGYIGDATTSRQTIEQKRSDFMAFFRIKHFYKVIYIFPDGTAIQRQRGYLTDAPTIPEIFQKFPEYSIALNFEDANYYEYAEDEFGDEIYAHIIELALSGNATGGLVWDGIGAVSNGITWSGIQTAQGEYIQITNELSLEAPLASVEMLGNAEQTTYSGKNLARPNANYTSAGISFVWNSDGTLTLNGTATNAVDVWVANGGSGAAEFTIPTGTKLTQSFRVVSGSASANTWAVRTISYYGGSTHWGDIVGNATFTASSETQIRGLEVLTPSGLTFNSLRLEIQLEESATATAWEPYVGRTASPNPDYPQPISVVAGENTVKIEGKNLFNSFNENSQWITTESDGTWKLNGTTSQNGYTQVGRTLRELAPSLQVGETYYLYLESDWSGNKSIYGTHVGQWGNSYAKTITEDMLNDNIIAYGGYQTTSTIRIMILKAYDTAYEPYQGQEFEVDLGSIELAKIGNYQDRIYKEDSKWYIEKQVGKVVLDGSEDWSLYSTTSLRYSFGTDIADKAWGTTSNFGIMCDKFMPDGSSENDESKKDMFTCRGTTYNNRMWFFNPSSAFSGTTKAELEAEWKAKLAESPVTVYFVLATSVDEEITNETLIAQLDALESASLYLGVNNIGTETQNAMPTLKIEYYTEYTLEGAGYEWEPGGNTAKTIVTVAGVDSAWPIWTVQGGAQNPTLTNITTGQTITWQGFVPEGQTLTINMAEMTADLAGANVFEYITGEWIRLAPGNNTLVYTAGNADKPSTLSWNGVLA